MPPELDLARPTLPITSFCPQSVLDSLQGFACLLSPRQTICAVSRTWSEQLQRGGRADLSSSRLLNEPFSKFLQHDAHRVTWKGQLDALARRENDEFSEQIDLGSEGRPFHAQLTAHGLWNDGDFVGFLVQGWDTTAELATRSALLDRERKLKDARSEAEKSREQFKEQFKSVAAKLQSSQQEVLAKSQQVCALFSQEPEQFGAAFCHFMKTAMDAKFTVLFNYNDDTKALRLGDSCDAPDFYKVSQDSELVENALGEGPSGITASERSPRCFTNLRQHDAFAPWVHLAIENKFNCIWSFPLLSGHRLVGVLQFYFEALEVPWSSEQQQLVQSLCTTAATLLWAEQKAGSASSAQSALEHSAALQAQLQCERLQAQLEQALNEVDNHRKLFDELNSEFDITKEQLAAQLKTNATSNGHQAASGEQLKALSAQVAEHLQQIAQQQSIIQHKEEQLALQRESLRSYAEQLEEKQHLIETLHAQPAHSAEAAIEPSNPAPRSQIDISSPEDEGSYRFIAGGMAEEFSNLLTGVLGHSSLAAAEMGDSHTAIADIRAIERAARNAAKLSKRLTALSGESRRTGSVVELSEFLKKYNQHIMVDQSDSVPPCVTLPAQPCPVAADSTALEVILDGMLEHAYSSMLPDTTCEWKLSGDEKQCIVTLHYFGPPRPPKGWDDDQPPVARRHRHYELFVSREAAKALGGSIHIDDLEGESALRLVLPAADQTAKSS